MNASAIFGIVAAPYLVESQQPSLNPYPMVFFLSAGLLLVATLFTIWGVRETVQVQPVSLHTRTMSFKTECKTKNSLPILVVKTERRSFLRNRYTKLESEVIELRLQRL